MKKIVPFTKDLMFKTKIGEITSIALDNTLSLDLQTVSGEFIVSGTYKMLEGSQIEEEFKYNIPVDITIDTKYETKNCVISIDDFSYEIINEENLKVNISVMLDDLDIKEDPIEKIEVVVPETLEDRDFGIKESDLDQELDSLVLESQVEEPSNLVNEVIQKEISQKESMSKEMIQKESMNKEIVQKETVEKEKTHEFQDKLFENMDDAKEYSIYRVYTVKEDDTLDIIYEKFNTSKEILADYNDLENLTIGTKLIIPSQDE